MTRVSGAAVCSVDSAAVAVMRTAQAAHSAAKDIKLEDALKGMPVPMHPGAERYFKEKGVAK